MKKSILMILICIASKLIYACPACEKQQPKILRGISHGTGPDSQWDYVIVSVGLLIVLLTLFYSIRWIFLPGEKSPNHIKQFILNTE